MTDKATIVGVAVRNRSKTTMRYVVVALLAALSFVPDVLLLPILGEVNFFLLVALWALLAVVFLRTRMRTSAAVATICALLLSVPPMPNYITFSNSGEIGFYFIGFAVLLQGWRGILQGFAFYLSIFLVVARLMQRSESTGSKSTGPDTID